MEVTTDRLLNEMKELYENAKNSGKTFIRWEELPPVVRAYIKSRLDLKVSGLDLGALATIIEQYEREVEQARTEAVELSEEEEEAIMRAVKEVEKEFEDPTEVGSDKYNEIVKEIAEILAMLQTLGRGFCQKNPARHIQKSRKTAEIVYTLCQ